VADLGDIQIGLSVDNGDVLKSIKTFEKMKRQMADLKIAVNNNTITTKQYNSAVAKMSVSLGQVTGNARQAQSAISKYKIAIHSATDAQLKFQAVSGKGMRRLEILAQQAGYQIGDLAVQIQGGTNAAVALGQQGSQLLGFFGPYGAIAGAALAIGTGLIAPFLKADKAAKDFQQTAAKALEDLESRISKLQGDNPITMGMNSEIARLQAEAEILFQSIEDFQESARKSSSDPDAVTDQTKALRRDYKVILDQLEEQQKKKRIYVEKLEEEKRLTEKIAFNKEIEANAAKLIEDAYGDILSVFHDMEQLDLAATEKDRLEAINLFFTTLQKVSAEEEKRARAVQKIKDAVKFETESLRDQIELLKFKLRFGEGSEQARIYENFLILDAYKLELARKGILGNHAKILIEIKETQLGLTHELKDQNKELKEKEKLLERISKSYNKILEKQLSADAFDPRNGGGAVEAMRRGVNPFQHGTSLTEPDDPDTNVGDYIQGLQNRISLETELLNVFGRERELRSQIITAQQEYGDIATDTQMRAIEGHLKEIDALEQKRIALEQSKQQVTDMNNFMKQSFEDTFMSVIDGTSDLKSAMQKLVSDLISEFMRMMVIKPLMNSIFGGSGATSSPFFALFGLANGGVMNKGNLVPFAQGGVVGGPTTFPMYGNKTGLMGEAGPEAIMPLRRGKGGKLGVEVNGTAGGDVIINHTFNFTANGDDSVKRIIAQSMPDITEATKASVLDARKRGGQFRRVFS
jgi:hypothetical protein